MSAPTTAEAEKKRRTLSYQIENLLLQGKPRTLIFDGLVAQAAEGGNPAPTWEEYQDAHRATIDRWMADANTKEESYAIQVRMLQHLYDKSYKLNDFKTAGSIAKDLNKLMQDHEKRASCRL